MKSQKFELLQVRRKVKDSAPMGRVLKYLAEKECNLGEEVGQMLEARFFPLVLEAEGKLDRATALDCLGKLRGYAFAIEQLLGIEPSSTATLNPKQSKAAEVDKLEDEDEDEKPDKVKLSPDDLDRMFGLNPDGTPKQ